MINDYICLDIENPNARGNSICSIGIFVVKDNKVEKEIYSVINPEDRFDRTNSQITGLCLNDVKDGPTFNNYWEDIKDLMQNNIIVGHNVTYDLGVISKSLERYDIEIPEFKYIDTCTLAKEKLDVDKYSLDSVCEYLNIEFEKKHNALLDAKGSYEIFEKLKDDNIKVKTYKHENVLSEKYDSKLDKNINLLNGIIKGITFDDVIDELEIEKLKKWIEENRINKQYLVFNNLINKISLIIEDNVVTDYEKRELLTMIENVESSRMYSETTLSLQILNGILDGIVCNNVINNKEIENLNKWLDDNEYLQDVYPYDKVTFEVKKVLEDRVVTENEKDYLLSVFNEIINPVSSDASSVDFNGKTFCLTGEFECGQKSDVSNKLQQLGGIEKSGVSAKLNYLIVGGAGSDAWKFGNVGGKQAKAMEYNEKGANIIIITEKDLIIYGALQ